MTAGLAVFVCSICGEPSTEICSYCTKDTCSNHRCDRCLRCSDCCECEVRLDSKQLAAMAEAVPDVAAEETGQIMPPEPDPDPPPVREPEPQPLQVHEPDPKPEEPPVPEPVPEPTDHKPDEL